MTLSASEWAELVGEDADDYMEVIEGFDHIESARRVAWHMGKLMSGF